ncbi:unnamed protein product [Closterium sp. NIES-53]
MVYLDKAWDMKDIPGGMLVCVVCCADSELVVLFVPLLVPMVYLDKAWDMKDIPGGTLVKFIDSQQALFAAQVLGSAHISFPSPIVSSLPPACYQRLWRSFTALGTPFSTTMRCEELGGVRGLRGCSFDNSLPRLVVCRSVFLSQACKLKRGDFDGAIEDSSSVLSRNENNAKALFRRAQLQIRYLHHFAVVKNVVVRSYSCTGGIKRELAAAKKKLATRKEKEKAAYAKMFG